MGELLNAILGRSILIYTGRKALQLYFRFFDDKKTKEWLEAPEDEMSELTGGCFTNLVGLVVLSTIIFSIGYLYVEVLKF